ncbi:preprotein translocase subunit SecG [Pinibacter soli]|uniref:Protein-export membrane protein SecG n=1 Tax=Pinibacter soli TaxID=3044211 RepID=A0ABT6RGQ7_9BACT|nr:preprotein translocase subunit SecG [Pinibacter soli]MDI3321759.1 preprotein translocase subunit SecG [Pinibacter soli]
MVILFVILIILACVVLGFVVLVQNPKGGGLAGNIGGISNQFMGVKQTTDVLEKGTWIFATVIALLCIFSAVFIPSTSVKNKGLINEVGNSVPTQQAPTQPAAQPVTPGTTK